MNLFSIFLGQKIVQKEAEIGTEADHEIGAGHGKEGTQTLTDEKADVIYVRKKVIKKLIVLIIDLMFMIEIEGNEEAGITAEIGIRGVQVEIGIIRVQTEIQLADQGAGRGLAEEGIHEVQARKDTQEASAEKRPDAGTSAQEVQAEAETTEMERGKMKDQQAEAKQDTEMEAQRVIKGAEVEIEEIVLTMKRICNLKRVAQMMKIQKIMDELNKLDCFVKSSYYYLYFNF